MGDYIHGYVPEEQERLVEQAGVLAPLIYEWIDFSDRRNLLEIGSGVGAQSKVLLSLYPQLELTCLEISHEQIQKAKSLQAEFADRHLELIQGDAAKVKISRKFDSAFICWVLEHVKDPAALLQNVFDHLDPGGLIYITEVFNSSFYFQPVLEGLERYYQAYNHFQASLGGNPDIGIRLGKLLQEAGFVEVDLHSQGFHLDQSQPEQLAKIAAYWKSLMKSASGSMLASGFISESEIRQMELALDEIALHPDGLMYYRFIQAKAIKP